MEDQVHESSQFISTINRQVLQALDEFGPASPVWLSRRLGIRYESVYNSLRRLRQKNLVVKTRDDFDPKTRKIGRPQTIYALKQAGQVKVKVLPAPVKTLTAPPPPADLLNVMRMMTKTALDNYNMMNDALIDLIKQNSCRAPPAGPSLRRPRPRPFPQGLLIRVGQP